MTAKRVDSNQVMVVKALRGMGASVWITSDLGKGAPDFVIGWTTEAGARLNLMVELKDGAKPVSQQKLTPAEDKFHDNWKGQICIIRNVEDAVDLINRVR